MIKDYAAAEIVRLKSVFTNLQQATKNLEKANERLKRARSSNNQKDKGIAEGEKKREERKIEGQNETLATESPTISFQFISATEIAKPEGVRQFWQENTLREPSAIAEILTNEGLNPLLASLEKASIPIAEMPLFSFHLSFRFALIKPFLSRDGDDFYIIDNPVKKDKVLKLSYVSPSSWKGALRNAARYVIGNSPTPEAEEDKAEIQRLFGTDKRLETDDLRAGRLRLFPTFFKQIGFEVINPHLRKTGAGDKPILFEMAKGEGRFDLLYFPFDLSSDDAHEAAVDLVNAVKAVKEMFTVYGFGAKTSDGFGTGEIVSDESCNQGQDICPNKLKLRFPEETEQKASPEEHKGKTLLPMSERCFNSFGELNKMARELAKKIDPSGGWEQ